MHFKPRNLKSKVAVWMPKLPACVFRRPIGSYWYKKSVLKKLSEAVEKATLYRLLGDSYADATWTLPKVNSEIETLFWQSR